MQNAIDREKDYRERGLFEEARDEKRWRKKLERSHKGICLGDPKIMNEDYEKYRKEERERWLEAHPNFLKEQVRYFKL